MSEDTLREFVAEHDAFYAQALRLLNKGLASGKLRSKCPLHPDDFNRARYDALGLEVCLKDNLSERAIGRHMATHHVRAWEVIRTEIAMRYRGRE